MNILLFGGTGQLGFDIIKRADDLNFKLAAPVLSEVDILNIEQIDFLASKLKPDLIINSAAYTAVDLAEKEQDKAFAVNELGVKNVAQVAKKLNCRLIHLSTDYVFPGDKNAPYKEEDDAGPLNVYGESKLAGEKAILNTYADNSLIIRTASLHGQRGNNFVNTMLKLFAENDEIKVVADQSVCITWTGWLAEVILDLARMDVNGIVHATCRGVITWHDFASKIYEIASSHNNSLKKDLKILKTESANYPRPAKRPLYSALDISKLETLMGRPAMDWTFGLEQHLKEVEYGRRA